MWLRWSVSSGRDDSEGLPSGPSESEVEDVVEIGGFVGWTERDLFAEGGGAGPTMWSNESSNLGDVAMPAFEMSTSNL